MGTRLLLLTARPVLSMVSVAYVDVQRSAGEAAAVAQCQKRAAQDVRGAGISVVLMPVRDWVELPAFAVRGDGKCPRHLQRGAADVAGVGLGRAREIDGRQSSANRRW